MTNRQFLPLQLIVERNVIRCNCVCVAPYRLHGTGIYLLDKEGENGFVKNCSQASYVMTHFTYESHRSKSIWVKKTICKFQIRNCDVSSKVRTRCAIPDAMSHTLIMGSFILLPISLHS